MKHGNNRGMTLVEVMVALAVLAILAIPLLSLYASSARTAAVSQKTTDAALAAQGLLEGMACGDYQSLLARDTQGGRNAYSVSQVRQNSADTFWYEVQIRPQGHPPDDAQWDYLHLFIYTDATAGTCAYLAGPDGKTLSAQGVTGVSVSCAGGAYAVTMTRGGAAAATLHGEAPANMLALVFGQNYSGGAVIPLTFSGSMKASVVCAPGQSDRFSVTQASTYLLNTLESSELQETLVKATVSVYRGQTGTERLAEYSDVFLVAGVGE
ncbi:MAG: type II secretion system protein [Eubacteriales bacterium]|nr:type II secretion system protein [Eubacteriales bacterium]